MKPATLRTIEEYAIAPSAAFLRAVEACAADEASHDVLDALAAVYEAELELDEPRHGREGLQRIKAAERAVVRRHLEIVGIAPGSLRANE